jgi:hypothetical protein
MSKHKYPRIGDIRPPRFPGKSRCSCCNEFAIEQITIQYTYCRGDDNVLQVCQEHLRRANLGDFAYEKNSDAAKLTNRIAELEKDNAVYIERIVRLTNRVSELEEAIKYLLYEDPGEEGPSQCQRCMSKFRKKAGL